MTRQRCGWGWALAAVLVVASACETNVTPDAAPQSDEAITTNVQARYFGDPEVKTYDVDVDTEDGVVTLSGTVESEAARTQAAALAQEVEGVARVQNDLRVVPPMAANAGASSAADSSAEVEPGVIADADAADDQGADRAADASPADAQPGPDADAGILPTDLDNRVNASWITMKIQAQYFGDEDVKGRRIDVDTSSAGHVTLKGELETEAARQRAVEIARNTEGVTDVTDELTVIGARDSAMADAEDGDDPQGIVMELTDPWVTAKIKSKYFLDEEVKGLDIDVTTEDGIVTLTGEVTTPAERRQAVALARATDGVADVRDQLQITGEAGEAAGAPAAMDNETAATAPPVDDEWIETRIESRYFLDQELKFGEIDVSSDSGDVTIDGEVVSEDAKAKAEEIARETSGVAEVVNNLAVSGESPSAIEAPMGQ